MNSKVIARIYVSTNPHPKLRAWTTYWHAIRFIPGSGAGSYGLRASYKFPIRVMSFSGRNSSKRPTDRRRHGGGGSRGGGGRRQQAAARLSLARLRLRARAWCVCGRGAPTETGGRTDGRTKPGFLKASIHAREPDSTLAGRHSRSERVSHSANALDVSLDIKCRLCSLARVVRCHRRRLLQLVTARGAAGTDDGCEWW